MKLLVFSIISYCMIFGAVAVGPYHASELVRHNEEMELHPKSESLYKDLGILKGVRQCGGSGKFVQWRNEACTENRSQGPCKFPAGNHYRGELTFIPNNTSLSIGVRTIVKESSRGVDSTAWQNSILLNSSVEAGKEYVVAGRVAVMPELIGKMITTQLSIYRESDKEIEVCAEADFVIV